MKNKFIFLTSKFPISNFKLRYNGFTLIELLVTIAIIGLLSTMALISVNVARQKAKIAVVQHDTDQIFKAITMLGNDTEVWPGQQAVDAVNVGANNEICDDGCTYGLSDSRAGITSTDGNYPGWYGPYMNMIKFDPWNNEYFFDTDYRVTVDDEPCNGGGTCVDAVVVGSYGPDGLGNNQYNGDDIIKILIK